MTAPLNQAEYDDLAVDRFAFAMKEKLARAREKGRGGWMFPEECTVEHLADLLVKHVAKGDPIDIANFCMMLHQRGAGTEVAAQALWDFIMEGNDSNYALDETLAGFYGVGTTAELVAAMEKHIQKLQAKLPQPNSLTQLFPDVRIG